MIKVKEFAIDKVQCDPIEPTLPSWYCAYATWTPEDEKEGRLRVIEYSEIERLKAENEDLKSRIDKYWKECDRFESENQKLKEAAAVLVGALNGLKNDYSFSNGATYDDIDRALKKYKEMMGE